MATMRERTATRTEANRQVALAGEADANRRYLAYGIRALRDGRADVAQLFFEAAGAETASAGDSGAAAPDCNRRVVRGGGELRDGGCHGGVHGEHGRQATHDVCRHRVVDLAGQLAVGLEHPAQRLQLGDDPLRRLRVVPEPRLRHLRLELLGACLAVLDVKESSAVE